MVEAAKRPRGRPRSVDREATVQIALENYWQSGLSSLSLNEVCRRAGISKPALYREFGGEDGLMAAVLQAYRARFVEPLLAPLAADRPFAPMLDGAITTLTSDRGTPPGCLFTKMRLAPTRLGPLATETVGELETVHRDAYEAWYRRALERGEANPDLHPEFAARYIDTQFATLLVQMENGVDPELVREQAHLALRVLVAEGSDPDKT